MHCIDILLYKNKWLIMNNNRNINEVEEEKKITKKKFGTFRLWNFYDIIISLDKLIINGY